MKRTYCIPQIEINEVEPVQLICTTTVPFGDKTTTRETSDQFGNSSSFDDGDDANNPIWDD